MYSKVIVPLDGSDLAEKALPYAEKLAGYLGAEVTLLHVSNIEEDKYDHMHQAYMKELVKATDKGAERYSKKASRKKSVVNSAHLVGHTAEQIVEYADKEKSSLIVMTTHGQSSIRRWLIGSVANKVVKATSQPVMLVRSTDVNLKSRGMRIMKKVLVPLDGSTNSEVVIDHIREIASKLKMEVTLLHVVVPVYISYAIPGDVINQPYSPEKMLEIIKKSEDYLDRIAAELRDIGIKVKYRVEVGSPAEVINQISHDEKADVVAMTTHGHTGISRWPLGNTSEKVLNTGSTTLMLVTRHEVKQEKLTPAISEAPTSIDGLIAALSSDDMALRVGARGLLVAKGRDAVAPLAEVLSNRKEVVRWEAAKALGEIGDVTAIQALIKSLEDKVFDVRWLAAEGLIDIGRDAIVPLLNALIEQPDSLWVREGAHHVLHDLAKGRFRVILQPVLTALEDMDSSVEVAPASYRARDLLIGVK